MSRKKQLGVDFRVPGKSNFERKIIDENIMEKNVEKPLASAGDADPGQGGIWEDNPRQAEMGQYGYNCFLRS